MTHSDVRRIFNLKLGNPYSLLWGIATQTNIIIIVQMNDGDEGREVIIKDQEPRPIRLLAIKGFAMKEEKEEQYVEK